MLSYLRYGAGFALAIVFLIGALSTYPLVSRNYDELLLGSDTHADVIRLISLIKDAETGQRGYLLTGKEEYLEPFTAAEAETPELFESLSKRILDPEQRENLGTLSTLYEQKRTELAQTIETRRKDGLPAALMIVSTGQGKALMDTIRDRVAIMEARERTVLRARAEFGSNLSLFRTVAMAAATLAVCVSGWQIIRMLNRINAERKSALELSERHVEQLRVTNESLNRANEELQHFAYVASHDLQEPLRSVSGYVQLLSRRYEGKLDDQAHGYIKKSLAAAQRMQRLIEDLLSYTRISTQGRPFDTVDLNRILDDAVANLNASIQEAGATVRYYALPRVLGDRVQLSQLFQNLVGNAIKFRGERAVEVNITAMREPVEEGHLRATQRWLFTVRDNGIGIEQEYQSRLFKIFQRLHTREEYAGTGVGLAICKRIVERHGGRIWLESEFGSGTAFHFTLPVIPGQNT